MGVKKLRREITDLGVTVGEEDLNEEEGDLGRKVRRVAKAEDGTQGPNEGPNEVKGCSEESITDKVGTSIQKERVHSSNTGDDRKTNSLATVADFVIVC